MTLTPEDGDDLRKAKALLEHPGLAARLTHLLGLPMERGVALLPAGWHLKINEIARAALSKSVFAAVLTLNNTPGKPSSNALHKLGVAATGGLGGLFGLPALSIELPVSTTIMLRSIADIARSEKENIRDPGTRTACVEVFALGGPSRSDDASETGYFAVRAALSQNVSAAAEYLARHGTIDKGAPALVRLIVQVAERFSLQVSEKAAAQAIPAIGAAGGALVNTLFINHFQDMARGHFIVRRFERQYGRETVETAYRTL